MLHFPLVSNLCTQKRHILWIEAQVTLFLTVILAFWQTGQVLFNSFNFMQSLIVYSLIVFTSYSLILRLLLTVKIRCGALISAVTSQQEGPGCESQLGPFCVKFTYSGWTGNTKSAVDVIVNGFCLFCLWVSSTVFFILSFVQVTADSCPSLSLLPLELFSC